MTNTRRYNHFVIFALILIVGLGFGLALPWLANAQVMAADEKPNEPLDFAEVIHSAELANALAAEGNGNTPTLDLCFATHNDGTDVFSELDASAVQQAVDAASSGDTVKVAGTCIGVQNRAGLMQTVYISKSLTLEGGHTESDWTLEPDPDTYTTTLDADDGGRVVLISGTIDVSLDSLFLTGGVADAGGGIYSNGALTLTNSTIYSNTAKGFGGGMYTRYFSPTLNSVDFTSNLAENGGGLYIDRGNSTMNSVNFTGNKATNDGGGLGINRGSSIMTNVNFTDNMATSDGGGLEISSGSSIMTNVNFTGNMAEYCGGSNNDQSPCLMTNLTFTKNTATSLGGGLCNVYSNSMMTNTLISGNKAEYGAGVYDYESESTFINATFSGNSALDYGGGMMVEGGSSEVYNSIYWNNQDSSGADTINSTIYLTDSAKITLTHSLVEGSGGSGVWALDPGYVNGGDNIDEDPMFVTPVDPTTAPTNDGNLRLTKDLPAIDAGDNQYITITFDLDNKVRKVDGNMDGTATVDMGAYETYPYDIFEPVLFR